MKTPGNFVTRAIVGTAQKITASWGWSSGYSSGGSIGFDGSKMRGALRSTYGSGLDLDHEALAVQIAVGVDGQQGGAAGGGNGLGDLGGVAVAAVEDDDDVAHENLRG